MAAYLNRSELVKETSQGFELFSKNRTDAKGRPNGYND
jgi:hypothetical protein